MRLFVAIDVGDALRAEAARVIRAIGDRIEAAKSPPKIAWVKPAALHVTLKFLGEVDEADLPGVRARLQPPLALAPFEVEWRGIGAFPSARHPRALWLGVVSGAAQLGEVEAAIASRFEGSPVLETRPLLPHLTLGRVKMAGTGVDWPKVLQSIDVRGVRSTVDRVTLYQSHLSHQGPHYTGLVSAPLLEP
jgi:2'-5' RNA ligase